ncbi:DUF3179 domain-containing protein [Aliikangiella coralliicola]|uniref:DUF3179 domain-containing protein n=1 Tax=Aliikangiella coralliicola TaxID=2592383 RepID=A0A545TV13_9GAMM|nr:DUF3179 domain-containing protein [Aliikangiella coralliicola]TQV81052.1 DUF3179 domain-containing protein [Aliikangiella coralliicola]
MKNSLLICLIIACVLYPFKNTQASDKRRSYPQDILTETFQYNDQSKRSIELSELYQGCPARDCIPAIDKPRFKSIDQTSLFNDDDLMFVVSYQGLTKVYPRKIMQVHEIVNDRFNDKPVAMTYCPLCGSVVVFKPFIDGKRVEFGVSGLLHNSDLVMYDRLSNTLWGQVTGRAIVGPHTGKRLSTLSSSVGTFKEVKSIYPNALVLEPPKAESNQYQKFHYEKYTQSDKLMFPVTAADARLANKKLVYGIEIDQKFIAIEEEYLKKRSPYVESVGKRTLSVTYKNGQAIAVDKKTGETLKTLRLYWFAWYAFHPDTELRH